ncbi:hypothetical protein AX17_004257 [Amanita inopinata Kibby_2008]|nr:hypothetical protein AX17_004257 [Amanita inopinata Kibby_2008]
MAIDIQPPAFPQGSAGELVESCSVTLNDPPPPYPARERRARTTAGARPGRRRHLQRIQTISLQQSTQISLPSGPYTDDAEENYDSPPLPGAESASLLGPPSPSIGYGSLSRRNGDGRRRSSLSHASVTSVAPSLAQTVLSLFQATDDEDEDEGHEGDSVISHTRNSSSSNEEVSANTLRLGEERYLLDSGGGARNNAMTGYGCEWMTTEGGTDGRWQPLISQRGKVRNRAGFFSVVGWRRYFRPLSRKSYYRALFHLLVLNFPYALVAWVYLFVFTLTGTTLLMALPLGAVLCFLNLLGARTFARGELALQYRFHSPLAYPPPYPPRPIFTRFRLPMASEIEMGVASPGALIAEPSFYKNTYSMFTDPTSYQALFYFLVIKPSITILLSLFVLLFVLPAMILIIPAPAALTAARKLGAWQANVAVEGLYLAVR